MGSMRPVSRPPVGSVREAEGREPDERSAPCIALCREHPMGSSESILVVARDARHQDGRLLIVRGPAQVDRVLTLTGVRKHALIFELAPTEPAPSPPGCNRAGCTRRPRKTDWRQVAAAAVETPEQESRVRRCESLADPQRYPQVTAGPCERRKIRDGTPGAFWCIRVVPGQS
jgi:hypothetical protein